MSLPDTNATLSAPPGMGATMGVSCPAVAITVGVMVGAGVRVIVGSVVGEARITLAVGVDITVIGKGSCPPKANHPPMVANKTMAATIQPVRLDDEVEVLCLSAIVARFGMVRSSPNVALFKASESSSAVL